MGTAPRSMLDGQVEDLTVGLEAFATLTRDCSSLLTRLDKHLTKMNKVAAPVYNQAAQLRLAEHNITVAKAATDKLIEQLATARKVEAALRSGPGRDLDSYLAQLKQLVAAMAALETHHTLPAAQQAYSHAAQVHRKAVQDCEGDFVSVLTQQTSASTPSVSALIQTAEEGPMQAAVQSPLLPEFTESALLRLRALAKLLKTDSQSQAPSAYAKVRKKALVGLLQGAAGGLPGGSAGAGLNVQGPEQAEKAAASWIRQLRMLTVAAASEVVLAEAVWGRCPEAVEVVGDVIKEPLTTLAQQGKDMAKNRTQQFRVFVLLDMLSHVEEVLPLMDSMVGTSAASEGLLQLLRDLSETLATAARELYATFETSIAKDASKAHMVDGTVHPLTAATLGYLRRLFTFGDTTQVLFVERGRGGMGALSGEVAARRMSESILQCMADLISALEVKAKVYKNRALAAIFLMNNVHYMVATVEQSDALSVLGKSWIEKHKDVIERYGQEYHDLVWMSLVRQLKAVESGDDPEPKDKEKWRDWVKRHFRDVNKMLEKAVTEQSAWSVPDQRLRKAVCRVVLQDLLPPYQYFWDTYSHQDFTSQRSKYVQCSPENMERMISQDLFQGRAVSVTFSKAHKTGHASSEKPMSVLPTLSEPSAVSLAGSAPVPRTALRQAPKAPRSTHAKSVR